MAKVTYASGTSGPIMLKYLKYILLIFIVILVSLEYLSRQHGSLSPQSKANIAVVNNKSIIDGLIEYPKIWPPVYPSLLWVFNTLTDLEAKYFNLFCFLLSLVFVCIFTKSYLGDMNYIYPIGILSINNAFYYNSYQVTSDMLFMALSLLALLLLSLYIKNRKQGLLIILGVLVGIVALTRYFGLIWLFPVILVYILFQERPLKERAISSVVYSVTAFTTCIGWFVHVKNTTGFITGMDRVAKRNFPKSISDWNELTDISHNILFAMKTYTLDIFAPDRLATHHAINKIPLNIYEIALECLVAGIILLLFVKILSTLTDGPNKRSVRKLFCAIDLLPAVFFCTYLIALIAVWTYGNSDPLYTRFVFPSYPFLILALFSLFNSLDVANKLQSKLRYALIVVAIVYLSNAVISYIALVA